MTMITMANISTAPGVKRMGGKIFLCLPVSHNSPSQPHNGESRGTLELLPCHVIPFQFSDWSALYSYLMVLSAASQSANAIFSPFWIIIIIKKSIII